MNTPEEYKYITWEAKTLEKTHWSKDELYLLLMTNHLEKLEELTPFKIRQLNRVLDRMNNAYETDAYGNFGD